LQTIKYTNLKITRESVKLGNNSNEHPLGRKRYFLVFSFRSCAFSLLLSFTYFVYLSAFNRCLTVLKNLYQQWFILMIFNALISACEKGPLAGNEVLYFDVDPDDTMEYNWVPWEADNNYDVGRSKYVIDLDQDGVFDFEIAGETWPDRFDNHSGRYEYSYETRIFARHDEAFIGVKDPESGSKGLGLNYGEPVNDKLEWKEEAFIYLLDAEWAHVESWEGDYIGLKLKSGNEDRFGWIDIDGDKLPVVKEYALNLTLNKRLRAGHRE